MTLLYAIVIGTLFAFRFQKMMQGEYDSISSFSRMIDIHLDNEFYTKRLDEIHLGSKFCLFSRSQSVDSFRRYNFSTENDQVNTEEFEKYFQLGAAVKNQTHLIWYPMKAQFLKEFQGEPLIIFSLSPEFFNDTMFNPLALIQSESIIVRKCLLSENCKNETQIQ